MATPKAAWGIEIGAYAIKAIRLERTGSGDEVAVSDFAVIPHKKVLTTPDLDQDEMVRLGLGQFISQKNLEGEHLVMSVPGHSAFARFAKLPPVEPKKVPDIVKFEAVQQIPFPIDEVEWDYQTFTSPDTPEIEVGIFAITRERVQQRLGLYGELGMSPESMTLSPVAVYNAMNYDFASKHKGPVVFIDIGTSATDVIVAEAGRCWIRTFPLGGTHFTEAIASAFKLSYSKAEKLKLEASDSKYAKQIMQAMRPVFSDLLQDLQRSISYYRSLHRESQLGLMVGMGSTFKIPGLRKFLSQQLQAESDGKVEIVRLDEYKRIAVTGREAASFAENAVNMATAYGLALQGVGLAQINANLVPVKTLRENIWQAKTKWFAAAAAVVIVGAGLSLYRPLYDRSKLAPVPASVVNDVISRGKELQQRFDTIKANSDVGATATNMLTLLDYRNVWPFIVHDAATALAQTQPQSELLGNNVEAILGIDPKVRKLVQLNSLSGAYRPPAEGQQSRRISVTMNVELSHERPLDFLNDHVAAWLRQNAEPSGERANVPYRIIPGTITINPTRLESITVKESGEDSQRPESPSQPAMPASPVYRPPSAPSEPAQPGGGPMPIGRPAPPPINRGPIGGGIGAGGTSPTPPPRAGGTPPAFGSTPPGMGAPELPGGPDGQFDLNSMAPIPPMPRIYPVGTTYYRVPVTFEIELLNVGSASTPTPSQDSAS
jgi:type IV pilus assembly protein PilM